MKKKTTKERTAWGKCLLAACQRRAKELGISKYSLVRLGRDVHVTNVYLIYCIYGERHPDTSLIERICQALQSPAEERNMLYNFARFLSPEEYTARINQSPFSCSSTAA